MRESSGDTVYRLVPEAAQLVRMFTVQQIAAPPLVQPRKNRLLIAEITGASETRLYTIDPICTSHDKCNPTRQELATVPYRLSSASFTPDGSMLAFTETQHGNVYVLILETGIIKEPLNPDRTYKKWLAYNLDGTALAYLDSTDNLYVLTLGDMKTHHIGLRGVERVAWITP
jgi:hypothetical protein